MPLSTVPTFDLELNASNTLFEPANNMTFPGNDTTFLSDGIIFTCGALAIELHRVEFEGKAFISAEYRSKAQYGYGRYECTMKPADYSGLVSSFFLFQDKKTDGTLMNLTSEWAEIDVEFIYSPLNGKPYMQFNHINAPGNYHEQLFDETVKRYRDKIRKYTIDVLPTEIKWYVDDEQVATANTELPYDHGAVFKVMMNLWVPTTTWAGIHDPTLMNALAIYKRLTYYPWVV